MINDQITEVFTSKDVMQAQFNNLYVANPLNIFPEFDPNQFDLVYLDPPYFESNVFKKNDIQSPYENFGEYLEYVVRIIFQSHRVLRDDGSILLRIDPLSLFNTRLFLDRIFGKQNFRAEIIWEKRVLSTTSNSLSSLNFESVFFYSKGKNFTYNQPYKELSEEEIKRQYRHHDEKGLYKLWSLFDNQSRADRSFEWEGFRPPKGKSWRYTKARLLDLDQIGEIEKSGKIPKRKIYLDSTRQLPLGFVWDDIPRFNSKDGQFDPRIQRAFEMASNSDADILCLFPDLATLNTIQKLNLVSATNRKWVGITPFNPVKTLVEIALGENSLFSDFIFDSNIQTTVIEMQGENSRGNLPDRIQRLINAEAQSIDSQSLPKTEGQKYAFLVGINHYTSGIGDLNYCVNDVVEFGQVFLKLGYHAKILHDESEDGNLYPNKSNIETELFDWVQNLSQEDTLYVHFSCHGTIVDETAMIITNDTRRQRIAQTALHLRDIISIIQNGRARKKVLSLDVCHGGAEMGRALVDQEFIQNVYEKAEGFVLLAASTARQQAYETHEHKHGLFTYFLIQGLSGDADRDEDGIITVNDLKDYTLDQVRRWNTLNGGTQEPTFKAEGIGDIPLVIQ